MTLTFDTAPATGAQIRYIADLATKRDYLGHVDGQPFETVHDVLGSIDTDDPKFISRSEASAAIDALLRCRPKQPVANVDQSQLAQALAQLPLSRYALPRKASLETWDFFEIVERKSGTRYLNRLIGAPGDWRRERLTSHLQLAAARAITMDPRASAVAYATQHGRCAVCDAHLSVPESIAQSMGPICAKRFA